MAIADDVRPAELAATCIIPPEPVARGSKRKGSLEVEEFIDAKRTRRESETGTIDQSTPPRHRRDSGPVGADLKETNLSYDELTHDRSGKATQDSRRKSATQEEKTRGRRLFGGLLNTLNQTHAQPSAQQRRRQEIEQRQQERLQKQKAEDEKQRAEKLSSLRDIRMAEQIVFEEKVMKNRHAKNLQLAHYIRTREKPYIYYLPWKLTRDQEDLIDDQIRKAKESNAREAADFKVRKQDHENRYGLSRRPSVVQGRLSPAPEAEKPEKSPEPAPPPPSAKEAAPQVSKGQYDESGDVLVEAEEDTVIY
ncbi:hypothetical protein S40288_09740 [Stachybotrys chartarum IBT 40288]|nr:hypothetical protein S40288_09740 [Stachybotrys chartarum IBT 40288]